MPRDAVRAVHKTTHEVRHWQSRIRAEDWLKKHDNVDDWDIGEDPNPHSWMGHIVPGPDGRDPYWGATYELGYGPPTSAGA